MKKLLFLFGLFLVVLCHSNAFAQQQEPKKDEKEPPKKAKVKIEKMDSRKVKRNFRNDEFVRKPKSTSRAEDRKLRKEQKEQRKKYEERRVDEQHGAVTRRMKRDERKANKFNESRSQTLSQSSKDANKIYFSLGWLFHRNKSKPDINGNNLQEANKNNSSKALKSQSARDANKIHFSLGWLFHRKNGQNKGGGEHRSYKGKN